MATTVSLVLEWYGSISGHYADWFGEWSPDGTRIRFSSGRNSEMLPYLTTLDPFEPKPMPVPEDLIPDLVSGQQPWISADRHLFIVDDSLIIMSKNCEILRRYDGVNTDDNTVNLLREQGIVLFYKGDNVYALELESGETWQVTDFKSRPGRFRGVFAANAEQIWFTWSEERSDFWVIDVEMGEGRE